MTAPRLRALHLFTNFKWTGPADPAIRCAARLRDAGVDVRFAQADWVSRGGEHRMAQELWNARLPVWSGLELRKHFQPASVLRDARRLAARLTREPMDVVHTHLLGDHLIAALAIRRLPNRTRPVLVRSLYEPEAPSRGWRALLTFRATDGVVAPTEGCGRGVVRSFGIAPARVLVQDPPVERRFRERLAGDLRARLAVREDAFLVGITARIQPHRRFHFLWDVARRVVDAEPRVRFVLLGRGNATDVREQVLEPVRARGLEDSVVLPGYLYEPDYSLALRALDAFVFLVPGSDGTCRAVREVMALGVPVLATPRGILPELLGPHPEVEGLGPSGSIAVEQPETFASELLRIVRDAGLRRRLGAAARARAEGPMDPERAARRLIGFYRRLLEVGGERRAR